MKKLTTVIALAFAGILLLFFFFSNGGRSDEKTKEVAGAPYIDSPFKAPKKNRNYWPTGEWRIKKPEETGINPAGLARVRDYAFTRKGKESKRKGIRTDGLVIIKNGYLVFEEYANGYDKDAIHLTWSVSKSFTNALFGIAVKEGRLKLNDYAFNYCPALNHGDHRRITIDQLLRMSSGLYANEGYEAGPMKSTVIAMLYTTGHLDMATYAAKQELEALPGSKWEYASTTANLLMGILRNTMTPEEYDEYPWKTLFDKIGMKKVVWERDASGNYIGSSYLYATPRDMAKFGYLFLNDGMWHNERILPTGWVAYSTSLAPAYLNTKLSEEEKKDANYGALWWLNYGVSVKNLAPSLPDAPNDMFMAIGHWGQYIFVLPSQDMVIAYTADNRDKTFNRNTLLKLIMDSIEVKAAP